MNSYGLYDIQLVRICETLSVRNEQNCLQILYVNHGQCNEQDANKGYHTIRNVIGNRLFVIFPPSCCLNILCPRGGFSVSWQLQLRVL